MRILDNKFHLEGEQIVKTSNGEPIPEDEPVFILRARDRLALEVLEYYRNICEQDGCIDFQLDGIGINIQRFDAFAREHPERMKQPGITRGK